MTKNKVLLFTALIELISMIVIFSIAFFLLNVELVNSLILALIVSFISGLSTYFYLVRGFGLDVRPWR